MKRKTMLAVLVAVLGLTVTSCKKEKGCTSAIAKNFNADAKNIAIACKNNLFTAHRVSGKTSVRYT